jgi:hypothetical protein
VRSGRLARTVVLIGTTVMALVVLGSAALAQPYPGGGQTPPPIVGGERFFRGDEGTARTGVDVLLLLLIALFLLVIGVILHSLNRRTAGSDR